MKRYNFDRLQNGRLMAEGVAVHAENFEEAVAIAEDLAERTYEPGWVLRFADNERCPPYFMRTDIPHRCDICYPLA